MIKYESAYEHRNGFISRFINELVTVGYFLKKRTLEMLAVSFWGFSAKSLL
jgi:hypothetical protein